MAVKETRNLSGSILLKRKKYALYLSVNVFSTKVLIVDTNFTSPNGNGAAILRGHLKDKGSTFISVILRP